MVLPMLHRHFRIQIREMVALLLGGHPARAFLARAAHWQSHIGKVIGVATKLKASSKFGRNKVKCERYKARGTSEKNAQRKSITQHRRALRDNAQRCDRLSRELDAMIDSGVQYGSPAYKDTERLYFTALKRAEKLNGVKA